MKAKGMNPKVDKMTADKAITDTLNGIPWQEKQMSANATLSKTFDQKMKTVKGNFTLTSTGLKARTKKTATDDSRKEREKRRRRLIAKQEILLVETEQ